MNRFVLDCSVVMAWCFEDETNRYTENILDMLSDSEALTPSIWPLEVTNVLLVGERKKRLTTADSLRFLELVCSLPIIVEENISSHIMHELYSLCSQYQITSYDAAYLELSIRKGLPLATMDKNLRKTAKKCGVSLDIGDKK